MTAYRLPYDIAKMSKIADPGTGNTIDLLGRSLVRCEMESAAGGETRILASPTNSGLIITLIHAIDSGDIDLTVTDGFDESNDLLMSTTTAGDFVTFMSVKTAADTYRWRVVGFEGFTGLTEVQSGDQTIEGTLAVTGATTLTGAAILSSTLAVTGATTLTGATSFGAATTGLRAELVDDGTTIAVTTAQSGAVFDLDSASAAAFTLPAAAVGLRYTFVCSITVHASTTITCAEGDFYVGGLIQHDIDTAASELATVADGSGDDRLTLNGSTTGGIAGSYVNMLGISNTQWLVWGHLMHSGSVADPFSAP